MIELGLPEGRAIGVCLECLKNSSKEWSTEELSSKLLALYANPHAFTEDMDFAAVANDLIAQDENEIALLDTALEYPIYGAEGIEEGALKQMNQAMRLPISRAGALMPDAHQGYGLPIGGVLATENAIIPYGVGVDIGCRMCMSVFELPVAMLETDLERFKILLNRSTKFGKATFKKPQDHEVLASSLFAEIPIVKQMHEKAIAQIGSSGGGNHFVEFGITEILEEDEKLGLKPGKYLGLLSHSGSRGFGATIAGHYTKLAMENCRLPHEVRHLAWLDLDSELGTEYWLAMNLAGEYASACHHQIHDKISRDLGLTPAARIENHHNFAWKEIGADGKEYIVHRKGATPASKDVLGIIPGSMTAPGFIVRGKGVKESINSAAHVAGRAMSRTRAKQTLDPKMVNNHLIEAGITLIGSGLDEAPMAYKNIHDVMERQKDLIEVLGSFHPKIVRMCGDNQFREVD